MILLLQQPVETVPQLSEPRLYSQAVVTWGTLKRAFRLGHELDTQSDSQALIDAVDTLVVEAFGMQFRLDELRRGTRFLDRLALIQAIVGVLEQFTQQPNQDVPQGAASGNPIDFVSLEIALVRKYGWSLADIDRADVESLVPFVLALNGQAPEKWAYCDQVNWL